MEQRSIAKFYHGHRLRPLAPGVLVSASEKVQQGRPLENLRVESCVVLVPGCTSASTYCIDVPPIGSRSSRLGGRVSNSVFYCAGGRSTQTEQKMGGDGRSSIHHLKLHQATRLHGRRWLRSLSTAASVNMSNGCLGDRASDFGATHSCRSATTSRSPKQAGSPLGRIAVFVSGRCGCRTHHH